MRSSPDQQEESCEDSNLTTWLVKGGLMFDDHYHTMQLEYVHVSKYLISEVVLYTFPAAMM